MISFTVIGTPQPQGSSRAFIPKGWKRPIITSANKNLKPWRQQVSGCATAAMEGLAIISRPESVGVEAHFFFDRPKSAKKDSQKTTKPDVDKLLRALLDSMTGIVFEDDSQVTLCTVRKSYGQPARLEVKAYGGVL